MLGWVRSDVWCARCVKLDAAGIALFARTGTGVAADIVTMPLNHIGMAGALHDPLPALLFGQVPRITHCIVNGRVVVRDGRITTLELPVLVKKHNALATQLANAAHSTR